VTWWNTCAVNAPVFYTQTVLTSGTLNLALPAPLDSDVGIKVERLSGGSFYEVFLPLVVR
jgi:hypothetical protein